jgi:hypothetical protein
MSWSGFKRGWAELRRSELNWGVFKRGQRELMRPPKRDVSPEAKGRRERASELGFWLFLIGEASRAHEKQSRARTTRRERRDT